METQHIVRGQWCVNRWRNDPSWLYTNVNEN